MNAKRTVLATLVIGLLLGTSVSTANAFSFREFFGFDGSDSTTEKVQKPGSDQELSNHEKLGNRGGQMMGRRAEQDRSREGNREDFMGGKMQMTSEMKTLFDEMKAAREDGDEAKVTELREKFQSQREAEQATREAAMDAAIAGGYDAWKTYVTQEGMPEEMTQKITAENFSIFVELHSTQKKVRELEEKLGMGRGMGFPGMGGPRGGQPAPFEDSQEEPQQE